VFSSVWLLSTVSIWGCAVALAVASSAAGVVVVAVVSAAGTSACLGSSLSWASSAFKDGELSVEALVALSVSAAAAAGFSSEEAAGAAACGAGCSEPVSAAPSPFFSSAGALLSLLPSSTWALSAVAASVAVGASVSLFSGAPSAGPSSFLSAASVSDAGASPFFSPLSFFLVMCPRKLAWILVAAL
uniref:Secreted protein n=1 Tax=Amazona collaria TaxID=241587 RepID=A0A8B9F007_9PSIT